GVAGAEPPHKGGRLRPTAPKEREERRENRRFLYFRGDRGMAMIWLLAEVWENSYPFWDTPQNGCMSG
ncbi:MAG: hypothetical protein OXF50_15970, partial [Caldilineaceae bacterium]|nr:hypothetical protein [Caldilineaceae bacterium]